MVRWQQARPPRREGVRVLFVCADDPTAAETAAALWGANARSTVEVEQEDVEWADVVVTIGSADAVAFVPGKRYVGWEASDELADRVEALRAELPPN